MQVIIPEQVPPSFKVEIEALTALPQIQEQRILGTLGVYKEYAVDVGHIALAFCQRQG